MNTERWEKAKELFADACELPEAERAAFLDRACDGDLELRNEVEQLFAGDTKTAAQLLEAGVPAELIEEVAPEPAREPTPQRIGNYQILETLGEGGMGRVYLAEQHQPVQRRVALKLIKLGMDSKQVLERFEAERQALARMEHDNIAKVFDAGTSETGQPYFVMEYVSGLPLSHFCDQRSLGIQERLELFAQICAGVQHAHQKGVIHRDLKPSNILVGEQDGKPVPKIIDFGIAKATDPGSENAAQFTMQGQVIGTPDYMSPEQAGTEQAGTTDIDTRTDVYSLGVLLYELLTGALPFANAGTPERGDPMRPSTRVSRLGEAAEQVAQVRRTTKAGLARELRGDLDWILIRALEADRERRYQTPMELADDIHRHLRHEPVEAGPPSTSYRIQKFVRRNRLQVSAAAAVLLTLVIGIVSSTFFMFEAEAKAEEAATNLDRFNLLANVVKLDEANAIFNDETALHPAWPTRIDALKSWIEEIGAPLEQELPKLKAALGELRPRATEPTAEDRQRWLRRHPRAGELAALRRKHGAMQKAQAVREGREKPEEHELAGNLPKDPNRLNSLAWPLVSPYQDRVWGQEAKGARLALMVYQGSVGGGPPLRARTADTLAWALFATGQDDRAVEMARIAIQAAPEDKKSHHQKGLVKLQGLIADLQGDKGRQAVAAVASKVQKLEAELSERREWKFTDKADQFLHDALAQLIQDLRGFTKPQTGALAQVRERLAWAERVHDRTITEPASKWQEAAQAISKADGKVAHTLYAKKPIQLVAQLGLVPIGMNPKTRLWEFYHLRSATDPDRIPTHDRDGNIPVTDDTGIIFVLVPGDAFLMGAQPRDENAPNYDAAAKPHEDVHNSEVDAYFLARHELTQGQWMRLSAGQNPSSNPPPWDRPDDKAGPVTLAHPVENVNFMMCARLLRQHGLDLPTEEEWEFAARAGTSTPWYTGKHFRSLLGHANILDKTAGRAVSQWGRPSDMDDGYISHAPVGTFLPNDFGLFDIHGNVWEWCHGATGSLNKYLVRGGAFADNAVHGRIATRLSARAVTRTLKIGVRPARKLRD